MQAEHEQPSTQDKQLQRTDTACTHHTRETAALCLGTGLETQHGHRGFMVSLNRHPQQPRVSFSSKHKLYFIQGKAN